MQNARTLKQEKKTINPNIDKIQNESKTIYVNFVQAE